MQRTSLQWCDTTAVAVYFAAVVEVVVKVVVEVLVEVVVADAVTVSLVYVAGIEVVVCSGSCTWFL